MNDVMCVLIKLKFVKQFPFPFRWMTKTLIKIITENQFMNSYLGISPILGARVFRQPHPSCHKFAVKTHTSSIIKVQTNKTIVYDN